jgi:hypothetical protein
VKEVIISEFAELLCYIHILICDVNGVNFSEFAELLCYIHILTCYVNEVCI